MGLNDLPLYRVSLNANHLSRQLTLARFFMANPDTWFSVKELHYYCFDSLIFLPTVYGLAWELPLKRIKGDRLVNGTFKRVFLFKFTRHIFDYVMEAIETNPVGALSKSEINLFKYYRLKFGITQRKLAAELAVAVSTIRRWEKGTAEPTFTIYQTKKLCRLYHLSLERFPDSFIAVKSNDKKKL